MGLQSSVFLGEGLVEVEEKRDGGGSEETTENRSQEKVRGLIESVEEEDIRDEPRGGKRRNEKRRDENQLLIGGIHTLRES